MNISKVKNKAFYFFLLAFPLILGLQPFFPKPLQSFFISLRLIILPVIILFFAVRKRNYIVWLFLLVLYFTIVFLRSSYTDSHLLTITVLSLFSSVLFFQAGEIITKKDNNEQLFSGLTYGVTIFNIISILLYILVILGKIDIYTIYQYLNKNQDVSAARFALGNAIMVPFTMTSLLMISILLQDKTKTFFSATLINLILTLISGSRVVFVIAFSLVLIEFFKLNYKFKIRVLVVVGILLFSLPITIKIYESNVDLLISRFTGSDAGSQADRIFIFTKILHSVNDEGIGNLFMGKGLTSSYFLMQKLTGEFRSIESLFLQLVYETGIIGFIMIFYLILKKNITYIKRGRYSIPLIFTFIQILFFLPVFSLMQVTFFLFGVTSGISVQTRN